MLNQVKRIYWNGREGVRNFLKNSVVDPVSTCTVRGHEIQIGFSNPLEGYRISTYATKEPETLDWLEKDLRENDVLFDIGANIGLYSIYAALVQPKCQVYSFEPEALNFTRLTRNILQNKLKNIVPMNVALSESTKFDFLYVHDVLAGAALHSFGESDLNSWKLRQGILGVSVDDLVFRFGLPQPTRIKLDVDGIEEKIVRGAMKTLANPLLREVLVEIAAEDLASNPIHGLLTASGLKQTHSSEWIYKSGKNSLRNFIYAKES